MLYSVARTDGDSRQINLTAAEAADAILSHDGAQWDIRMHPDTHAFELWSKTLNDSWVKTVIYSLKPSENDARAEIFQRVVDASPNWRGGLHAETMQSYQERLVE